ncbi:hypothetical protein DFS33DRAFT_14845 [Desarmillaria ectypa]|nr:hypothetical protein DFS33DRAFT_14845 [Desarmillaria ectypa]
MTDDSLFSGRGIVGPFALACMMLVSPSYGSALPLLAAYASLARPTQGFQRFGFEIHSDSKYHMKSAPTASRVYPVLKQLEPFGYARNPHGDRISLEQDQPRTLSQATHCSFISNISTFLGGRSTCYGKMLWYSLCTIVGTRIPRQHFTHLIGAD